MVRRILTIFLLSRVTVVTIGAFTLLFSFKISKFLTKLEDFLLHILHRYLLDISSWSHDVSFDFGVEEILGFGVFYGRFRRKKGGK